MNDKCEPPEDLAKVDGWHWVRGQAGSEFIAEWRVADHAGLKPLWRIPLGGGTATPEWTAEMLRWRYLSPVFTPAEADALRAKMATNRQKYEDDMHAALLEVGKWSWRAGSLDAELATLRACHAELLAALDGVVAAAAHENWHLDTVLSALLNTARAAIAKATTP